MSTNEIAIRDRQWRLHPLGESSKDPNPESKTTSSECGTPVPTPAVGRGLRERARDLVRRMRPGRGFESTLRDLTADWENARGPAEVEISLLSRLMAFAPGARFELLRDGQGESIQAGTGPRWSRRMGEVVVDVPLRTAGGARDRLRIYHPAWGLSRISSRKFKRIRLLCELSTRARESLRPRADCPWEESTALWRDESRRLADWTHEQEPTEPAAAQSPMIRDATFLSAILPFAIAQAKRHREPLSIACVAIDRLGGVRNLLGRQAADQAITMVGEIAASMIRTSDIVCRLDDDRILVVLPRAAGEDAVHISQSIRRAIAARPSANETGVGLTVSIGVASYPTCANNVFALFDAVDEALDRAQKQGRDQVALAHVLTSACAETKAG